MVKASRNFPKQPQRTSHRPRRESEGARSSLMVDGVAVAVAIEPEDFAGLLEAMWRDTDISEVVDSKEYSDEDEAEIRLRGRQVYSEFGMGMESKASGLFDLSSAHFESMLEGKGVSVKMRFLAMKNMADIAHQLSNTRKDPDQRLYWLQSAASWFQKIDKLGWGEEPSASRLHTAIQSSKVALDHQFLIEDIGEQKRLLEKAYERLDVTRGIIAPFNKDNWEFILHSTIHMVARRMTDLTRGTPERREWLVIWEEETEKVLAIARRSAHPRNAEIKEYYLAAQAHALAYLGREEDDPAFKLEYEKKSYESLIELFSLQEITNENFQFVLRRMEMAAGLASQISNGSTTPEERSLWLSRAYDINKRIIGVASRMGLVDVQQRNIEFAVKAIDGIIPDNPRDERVWTERKVDEFVEYAELMANNGELPKAAGLYSVAIRLIDQLMVDVPEENKISLLRRRRDLHLLVAKISIDEAVGTTDKEAKGKVLKRASVNFSFAAGDAREIYLLEQDAMELDNNALIYHDSMIESANAALINGDMRHGYHGYSMAAEVSEKFSTDKSDEQQRLLWFQKLYGELIKSAEIAFLVGDYAHSAIALGIAAKTAQRAPSEFKFDEKEWLEKARNNNQRAGECWERAGRPENARRAFKIASIIDSKITF